MEARIERRFPATLDVTVVGFQGTDKTIAGQVVDISGSGACLLLPVELAPSTSLKLEISGSALFGHVVYANPSGGQFHTGIEITSVLFGENDLSKLLQALLAAESPSSVIPGK